ncbi:Ferritin light chain [Myotis davidii]|uniref:Ferritin light chain n=1 Tax=Myotis davidii TaxID=225400 RepID=L5M4P8_MYODS|nr:Ferritin light chain [Myotis davidii]
MTRLLFNRRDSALRGPGSVSCFNGIQREQTQGHPFFQPPATPASYPVTTFRTTSETSQQPVIFYFNSLLLNNHELPNSSELFHPVEAVVNRLANLHLASCTCLSLGSCPTPASPWAPVPPLPLPLPGAQTSAPPRQLTDPLRGEQHRDDFLRQQQRGCAGLASRPCLLGDPGDQEQRPGHFFQELVQKLEGSERLLKMQNQCSGLTLFQDVLKPPQVSGQNSGRQGSRQGIGEEPDPGPVGAAGLGSNLADPQLRDFRENHFRDEEVKLIKKMGSTRLSWASVSSKGSPSGTTRSLWSQRPLRDPSASPWCLACLSLSPKLLAIPLTTWSPLPCLGPNGNNKAFCKKKKKYTQNTHTHTQKQW